MRTHLALTAASGPTLEIIPFKKKKKKNLHGNSFFFAVLPIPHLKDIGNLTISAF